MKRILNVTLWIVVLAGITVLLSFINAEKKKILCKSFEVEIEYYDSNPMISPEYVKQIVYSNFDSIIGERLSEIDIVAIEEEVKEIPFVESAEVYASLFGNLNINVVQRQPIIRIINSKNKSFYIDQTGAAVPIRSGFSCRTLIASGHIRPNYDDMESLQGENSEVSADIELISDLYILATYIKENEFLNAQIEQIYVNKSKEFELIPKVGRQIIFFGGIDSMETKFSNLITFYNKVGSLKDWNKYKTINLKYENQIVCAK